MIILSKGKSKYLRSLRRRKIRYQERRFVIEGEKMCLELIEQHPKLIELLLLSESSYETLNKDILFLREKLNIGSESDFKVLSELENNSGYLAVVQMPEFETFDIQSGRFVYLDGIQDPGNLGGIFRTAAWYGINGVILGPGTVDPYNAKVIQASMGAVLQVPHQFSDLKDLQIREKNGAQVMGLDLQGESLANVDFPDHGVLVVGSEGQGISEAAGKEINQWWHIPKANDSRMESLNAGVAIAIALDRWCQKK